MSSKVYEIVFKKSAAKELQGLPQKIQQKILDAVQLLSCLVRAAPAQIGSEFKSTSVLKATSPVPSAFFSALELAV
jgi:hypothetical protein